MPGGDGTGRWGVGPRTGRGLGPCNFQNDATDQETRRPRRKRRGDKLERTPPEDELVKKEPSGTDE